MKNGSSSRTRVACSVVTCMVKPNMVTGIRLFVDFSGPYNPRRTRDRLPSQPNNMLPRCSVPSSKQALTELRWSEKSRNALLHCTEACQLRNASQKEARFTWMSMSVAKSCLSLSLLTLILLSSPARGTVPFLSPVVRSKKGNIESSPRSTAARSTYVSRRRASRCSGSSSRRAGRDQCNVSPHPEPRELKSSSRSKILKGMFSWRSCCARSRPDMPASMISTGRSLSNVSIFEV